MKDSRFIISTNRRRLDLEWVCRTLRGSYWGDHLSDSQILLALEHSLCFGVYELSADLPKLKQVGLARVVTDHACFSSVTDVIIDPAYRGRGLGTRLMRQVVEHPSVARTICVLASRDSRALYAKVGFQPINFVMQRDPDKR
jgi:ribosomal protein S18 acetylase RimI-like enzyme